MFYISIPCRYTGSYCKINEDPRNIALEVERGKFLEPVRNLQLFSLKTFMGTNK